MKKLTLLILMALSFSIVFWFPKGSVGKWDDHHAIFESVLAQQMKQIIQCESGGQHFTPQGRLLRGDNGKAAGKHQFHKKTFEWLEAKAGWSGMDWTNEKDQEKLFNWAVRNGYAGEWTCAQCLHLKLGRYAAFKIKTVNVSQASCKPCKFQTASRDKDKNKIKAKIIREHQAPATNYNADTGDDLYNYSMVDV